MKKTIILLLSLFFWAGDCFSQTSIVVQNGNKLYVSDRMDSVKANLSNGDTVYLPGGVVNLIGDWNIDKKLHIFGAGFFPDSSVATERTYLPTYRLRFINGSDSSSLEGVEIEREIGIGFNASNDSVKHVLIKRCSVSLLYLGGSANSRASNIVVSECFIRNGMDIRNAKYVNIEKCLINGRVSNVNGNVLFTNNAFSYFDCSGSIWYPLFANVSNALMKNNLFLHPCLEPAATFSTYSNNIFCYGNTTPFSGTNIVNSTNIFVINSDSIKLVNYPLNKGIFDFSQDLHLMPNSPAKNAGDDGYDLGIYGTSLPTKEGWVPMTPHIEQFKADPKTSNGKLNVEIKVRAEPSY